LGIKSPPSTFWLNDTKISEKDINKGALTRYVTNLLIVNEDPTYQLSLRGSLTLVRFDTRYLGICCRHQIKGCDIEKIGIFLSCGKTIVTSNGGFWLANDNSIDAFDLLLLDFSDTVKEHPELASRFFAFDETPPDYSGVSPRLLQVSGFPYFHQKYELDNGFFGSTNFTCICDDPKEISDPSLIRITTSYELDFDPDGLSGGSVFSVQLDKNIQGRVFFAGIVTRAGKNHVHFIKSDYIKVAMVHALKC